MYIFRLLLTFISNLLARLFAWRCDRHKDPENVSEKRCELLETVITNGRVLEIGAGTGSSLACGAYDGPTGRFEKVILTEPDNGMRARLESKVTEHSSRLGSDDVSVMDASVPDLPFADGEFDAVVMYFVASHISNRAAAARAIARVLKPGGKLLFMDHGVHDHGHGHGHGQGNSRHEHSNQNGHGNGHDHEHEHGKPKPWFLEWIRFMALENPRGKMDLGEVLKELRAESSLQEEFQTRMDVNYSFNEVTYGVFTRKD